MFLSVDPSHLHRARDTRVHGAGPKAQVIRDRSHRHQGFLLRILGRTEARLALKLEESRTAFYKASDQLSENARTLSFAGVAIVWVFRVGDRAAGGIPFSKGLVWSLGLFALSLLLDLLHYLYKALAWRLHYSYYHKRGTLNDAEVDEPSWINIPAFVFFYGKLVTCVVGFFLLLWHISCSLH